jgi:phosphoribosylanthranilate isomerase
MITHIKICGITRTQDADVAVREGAHAIGLVFYEKSPRYIGTEQAKTISEKIPAFVTIVGLFVNATLVEIENVINHVNLDLLQFHGEESAAFCEQFRLPYIKAIRVKQGDNLLKYASEYKNAKDLLLDAFVEGTHGGTGAVFDWSLVPKNFSLPIILSGGLNVSNVAAAVKQVRPYAVDVSSGVEASKGIKDAQKIASFIREVKNADV